ncbi:MAG TPA: ABC transporter permease [Candidatus Dormibacteraeota bacterium]|nr:ABC transporter permease [Candidatus Dormibacteraeota bacterium]
MPTRSMFLRILWKLLGASRGRLLLALVALASGAAICSALLNVNLDAEKKLTQEFRTFGANVVIAPKAGDNAALADAGIMDRIAGLHIPQLVAAAPYLYIAANSGTQPVILAGTWFDQVAKMDSWWKVQGKWVSAKENRAECLVGQTAARQLGLSIGSSVELRSGGRNISLSVAGIVTTGGSEDNQILTWLDVAQGLAGFSGKVSLVQLSVSGRSSEIEGVTRQLAAALPGLDVRPVRQIAAAQGTILGRIRGLIFWTIALILILSMFGVLASMAALAMERSKDVGLMKALGGSVGKIMRLFLAEAGALGLLGGTIGFLVGVVLARWIGWRVFNVAISPHLEVLPITVALTVVVALAGALPLRFLGRVRPAEILRGE